MQKTFFYKKPSEDPRVSIFNTNTEQEIIPRIGLDDHARLSFSE